MKSLLQKLTRKSRKPVAAADAIRQQIPEISDQELALLQEVRPYTMTGPVRLWSLMQAVHHVNRHGIAGDVVECGVWRGGNVFLARRLQEALYPGVVRNYFLYDTFAGMAEPTEADLDSAGNAARADYEAKRREGYVDWCFASLDDVQESAAKLFGQAAPMRFIQGKVEDTLRVPANLPASIAILRLDTDWYESTRAELEVLYSRLAPGGVLIIDDYGYWQGARKAVDEFFAGQPIWLHRVDHTCRVMLKPER